MLDFLAFSQYLNAVTVPKCLQGHVIQGEDQMLDTHLVELVAQLFHFWNLHFVASTLVNKSKLTNIFEQE